MTPDTPRRHTRRDLLKYTGSCAIATVVAGCNELSGDEDDERGGDNGGDGTGGDDEPSTDTGTTAEETTTGSQVDPGGVYAVDPAAFAEGADGPVRAAAVDSDHATVGQPMPGVDAETHLVTYGHDATEDGGDPGSPDEFGFGVLTTAATDATGDENPLGSVPLVDLLTGEQGAVVRRAIGLGSDPTLVADPVQAETRSTTALDVETTAEAFVVAYEHEGPDAYGASPQGPSHGVGLATVYASRLAVGQRMLVLGMVDPWQRPPEMTPGRVEFGESTRDIVQDAYQNAARMELYLRAAGSLGRLGVGTNDLPPAPKTQPSTHSLSRDRAVLTDTGQERLGYPNRDESSGTIEHSYVVGRDDWTLGQSYEDFDRGTAYELTIEYEQATYTLGSAAHETFPLGVVTAPSVVQRSAEQNPLATAPLVDLLGDFHNGFLRTFLESLDIYDNAHYIQAKNTPKVVRSSTSKFLLGRYAESAILDVTFEQAFAGGGPDLDAEVHVARIRKNDEVVLAFTVNVTSGSQYWDDRANATELFDLALDRLEFGHRALSSWADLTVSDTRLVQAVSNTELVDDSGPQYGTDDPDLVAGHNVAPVFDFVKPGVVPEFTVIECDVAGRTDPLTTRYDHGTVDSIAYDTPRPDPAAVFQELTQNGDAEDDPIVFELDTANQNVTVAARAPSGYKHDEDRIAAGSDYDITTMRPLRIGFISVTDPDNGPNYGNGNGEASTYDRTVAAACQYLWRTWPGDLYAYRHDPTIAGHRKGAFSRGEFRDYGDAQTDLERASQSGTFPNDGTVFAFGGSTSDAETAIENHGFDSWVLVVPTDYYDNHGRDASGFAPYNASLAVSALEATARPADDSDSSATIAQELAHGFSEHPYDDPGPNGNYPLAQRDDSGTDRDISGGLNGEVDLDHARVQDSNLDDRRGPDDPGVVSEAYDLTDGTFTQLDKFTVESTGVGVVTDSPTTVGRMRSFMGYGAAPEWTDTVVHQALIDSGWNRVTLGENIFSGMGTVEDDGTVRFVSMRTFDGKPMTTNVDDGDTVVEFLAPDGEILLSRRVSTTVDEHHGHEQGPFVVQCEFPDTTATLRTTHHGDATTTTNPLVGVLEDALDRIPDRGFLGDPESARDSAAARLDAIRSAMAEDRYTDAGEELATLRSLATEVVRGEYEAHANQPARDRLLELVDEVSRRLESLGEFDAGSEGGSTGSWSAFQRDAGNTGALADPLGPTTGASATWETRLDTGSLASPTTDGETVFVGDDAGTVYALAASDGTERWRTELDGYVRSAPTVVDGALYVVTGEGTLFALDAATGEERWRNADDGSADGLPSATSSPTVVENVVYYAAPAGTVYALTTAGEVAWTTSLGGECYSTPAVVDGVVYVGHTGDAVVALSANTGEMRWLQSTSGAVRSSVTVTDGVAVVGTWGGTVEAFAAAGGDRLWTHESDAHLFVSSPATDGDALYLGSGGWQDDTDPGHVHALDLATGEERWRLATADQTNSSPAVTGDTVFVGSGDANVYALAAATGEQRWRFDTGGEAPVYDNVTGSPAVVDGRVYAVGSSGRGASDVFALDGD